MNTRISSDGEQKHQQLDERRLYKFTPASMIVLHEVAQTRQDAIAHKLGQAACPEEVVESYKAWFWDDTTANLTPRIFAEINLQRASKELPVLEGTIIPEPKIIDGYSF